MMHLTCQLVAIRSWWHLHICHQHVHCQIGSQHGQGFFCVGSLDDMELCIRQKFGHE